jgi:hypothetical protein
MTPPLVPLAPLSRAAALVLAQAHVARLNAQAPPPGTQRWIVSEPVEYTPYWYFDYQTDASLTWSADLVPDLADCFGYPPGYLLWKQTHACSLVGWGELSTLDLREQLFQQASHLAQQLVAEPLRFAQLRPHLRVPLPELVQLTQQVRRLPDAAAQVAHLFVALHVQALTEARLAPLPFLPLD